MFGKIKRFFFNNKIDKKEKPVIITEQPKEKEYIPMNDINMKNVYLVTLDTTNRPEAKKAFKREGIQNFYFVYVEGPNIEQNMKKAQEIVLSTFTRNAQVFNAVQYSIKATPINFIINNLSQQRNFWTYIPFGGQRMAGQQSVPMTPEMLLKKNEYGLDSAQNVQIPRPQTVNKENSFNADDIVKRKQPQPALEMPTDPSQMTPEAMMAMMQKMMTMMQNGAAKPKEPTKEEIESVGKPVSIKDMDPKKAAKLKKQAKDVQIGQDYHDPAFEAEIKRIQESGEIPDGLGLTDIDMDDK
jgi:hypothetical protein